MADELEVNGESEGLEPKVNPEIAALEARFKQEMSALRHENGKHRQEKHAAQQALDEARRVQGEFEPLWRQELEAKSALEARLAELEPGAQRWKEFETSQRATLEARMAKLGPDDADIVRAIPDVAKALAALTRLEAKNGTQSPQKKQAPGEPPPMLGTPPTGKGTVDFFGARSKEELRELMDKHPEEFSKLESSYAPKPKTFLAGLWAKK